ncbi:protein roadkill-like [Trichogramma pretiosum]|uniref:protein roadkill-like n=1 Tax=Trichogramma pretiosum TaxID=7493 RepID=UPI000C71BCBF|nr:protein roadkill-like [Trichogramma pretiosum]
MSSDETVLTGYSLIEKESVNFRWVISDYILILEKGDGKIRSPLFSVNSDDKIEFQLELKKSFVDELDKYRKFIRTLTRRLSLMHVVKNNKITPCEYKISVIRDGKSPETHADHCTFSTSKSENVIFNLAADKLHRFVLPTGALTILCELEVVTGDQKNSLKYESTVANHAVASKYNFDWIFLNENLSDVKLRVACGKEIPAHKVVLANASPVFKAMFSLDMLENKSNSVDMVDISHEAAVEMLRYVYTGRVENEEISLTIDLLAAADKYQLQELKDKCEKILSTNLSSGNAIEVLTIADKYDMSGLKKDAIHLVKRCINKPAVSDDASTIILGMAEFLSK